MTSVLESKQTVAKTVGLQYKEQDLKGKLFYIQDFAMPQKAKEQRCLVHT